MDLLNRFITFSFYNSDDDPMFLDSAKLESTTAMVLHSIVLLLHSSQVTFVIKLSSEDTICRATTIFQNRIRKASVAKLVPNLQAN